jgi:hypothetical protein
MIVPTRERSQGAASTVPDGIMKIVVTGAQEDPASITWLFIRIIELQSRSPLASGKQGRSEAGKRRTHGRPNRNLKALPMFRTAI